MVKPIRILNRELGYSLGLQYKYRYMKMFEQYFIFDTTDGCIVERFNLQPEWKQSRDAMKKCYELNGIEMVVSEDMKRLLDEVT